MCAAEGLIFNIDGPGAPGEVMNYAPRPEQLSAPFAADAHRCENGQLMAGPGCKFARGCENIATQSLKIFNRLGDQLTVWESFKIYDGKIHAVEAFMRILGVARQARIAP
jgi:hypothetical protein